MRLRGVSVGGRLPARSATGTATGESWPSAGSGARTSIGGWCARDGRSRTGTTRWTMYPTSGRHELRSGGCGVATSCRLGGGGRVSGSRAGPPSPGRVPVPVAVAGSRGTSAARECGSTMFRVVSRTTRLGSIPRRASAGSARRPKPGRRGGGRRGGNLARRPWRKFLLGSDAERRRSPLRSLLPVQDEAFGSLVAGLLSAARAATGASGGAAATPLQQATSLQLVVPPIGERVRLLYVDPARGIG